MIIGIGHYAGTGKDTFADMLLDKLDNKDVRAAITSLADGLKEFCADLFYWTRSLGEGDYYDQPENREKKEEVIPALGKSPRQIWIEVGNKMREVYPDVWIDYVLKDVDIHTYGHLIIPDVRFPNEVERIKSLGGKLVLMQRPGVEPGADVSDRALLGYDGWDYTITNTSLKSLGDWADMFAACVAGEAEWPKQVMPHTATPLSLREQMQHGFSTKTHEVIAAFFEEHYLQMLQIYENMMRANGNSEGVKND